MADHRLGPQQMVVREAVKQFPGSTIAELSLRSLIPRAVFHRRLVELVRFGVLAKDADGRYHGNPTPEDLPPTPEPTCNGTSSTQ